MKAAGARAAKASRLFSNAASVQRNIISSRRKRCCSAGAPTGFWPVTSVVPGGRQPVAPVSGVAPTPGNVPGSVPGVVGDTGTSGACGTV